VHQARIRPDITDPVSPSIMRRMRCMKRRRSWIFLGASLCTFSGALVGYLLVSRLSLPTPFIIALAFAGSIIGGVALMLVE
jgi:hypothetical protein